MNEKFIRKPIMIADLYVNPDNARFYKTKDLADEPSAIEEIVRLNPEHVISLGKDIQLSGLNPNTLPIVIPHPEFNNKYIVADGNRRITSIKLMTQYNNKLKTLNIPQKIISTFSDLKADISEVYCVVYEDETIVNGLLEKIHTSKPGVGQVNWDPLAQDYHKSKVGTFSKRFAIVEFLKYSSYTTETARKVLESTRWLSKLRTFAYDKYMSFFGIKFTDKGDIILLLEEKEVVKALSQLVFDLANTVASKIAQTETNRLDYLYKSFPESCKPDKTKINKDYVVFDIEKRNIIITKKEETNDIVYEPTIDFNTNDKSEDDKSVNMPSNNYNNTVQETSKSENPKSNNHPQNTGKKDISEPDSSIITTSKRNTLINSNEVMNIKDQRTKNLYAELQTLAIVKYTNVVSVSFRSLIEFSVNYFLEKRNSNLAYNQNITLIDKIEKVYCNLESKLTSKTAKIIMPAFDEAMCEYRKDKHNKSFVSILNNFIHNLKYHPEAERLKNLYDNIQPFLYQLWENVN